MTLDAALDSASGDNPALNMELARRVIGCFQRLHSLASNRGDHWLSEVFRNYTENFLKDANLPVVPHKAVAEVSKIGNL